MRVLSYYLLTPLLTDQVNEVQLWKWKRTLVAGFSDFSDENSFRLDCSLPATACLGNAADPVRVVFVLQEHTDVTRKKNKKQNPEKPCIFPRVRKLTVLQRLRQREIKLI